MSRSYKETPVAVTHSRNKNQKRLANKRARKVEDLPSGNGYRKLYDKEKIKVFASRATYPEFLEEYSHNPKMQNKFSTEEQLYKYWKLHYIGK